MGGLTRRVAAGCAAAACAALVAGCGGAASDGTWDAVPADASTWVRIGDGVAEGKDRGVAFRGVLDGDGDDLRVEWCAQAAGQRGGGPGLGDLLCTPGTTRARVDGDTLTLTRGTLTITLTRR